MPNPFEGFEAGYNVSSKGRKPLQGVMEDYDANVSAKRKLSDDLTLEREKARYKSMYKDPESNELNEAKTAYYNSMAAQKSGDVLTPSQNIQKKKSVQEIFGMVERNKVKRGQMSKAKDSLGRLPKGLFGKVQTNAMKMFDPDNPVMGDWQNVKSVLTDAQLMNVAKTKGAISDREMELFAQAAANDDMVSVARMKPVLDRLSAFIDAEENSTMDAYLMNYGEDPRDWFSGQSTQRSGDKKSEYNNLRSQGVSPEEARRMVGL